VTELDHDRGLCEGAAAGDGGGVGALEFRESGPAELRDQTEHGPHRELGLVDGLRIDDRPKHVDGDLVNVGRYERDRVFGGMTAMPSNGRILVSSVRAWQAEHVLRDIRQDQVGRDRRDLVQPGLAELALDIVFAGEAETAVELQAGIGRFP
jgi:hypothetical protein